MLERGHLNLRFASYVIVKGAELNHTESSFIPALYATFNA